MKEEKPRDLALKILNELTLKYRYSVNYLDDVFQRHPYLDDRDRAFISHLVQGVLRWRLRLDWVIGQFVDFPLTKIDLPVLNILRLALYQIFFLDKVPESAAVNEAVNQVKWNRGARHVTSFVNGLLRNICRQKDRIAFPDRDGDKANYMSVFYSYPRWLVDKWLRELGEQVAEELLSAQNNFPDLNIRTNTLKISRSRLIEYLANEGITGEPSPYAPEGILLKGFRGRVDELTAFKRGLFQVQDQAAQIASYLIAPQSGDSVLDICAGFGGKSTHMAALMGEEGQVLALDMNRGRLVSLENNSRRLGVTNIRSIVADASSSLSSLLRRKFKRAVVDAPCSGLGVISRHPDSKWNRDENDIGRLANLQRMIMDEAASVIQRGGNILYVTCTISKDENEDVVKHFLYRNKDIFLENLKEHIPEWGLNLIDGQGFYRTFPSIHNMDGFFAALFTKN